MTETAFAARPTVKSTRTHCPASPSVTWPRSMMMPQVTISTKCPDLQLTFPKKGHQTTSSPTTTTTKPNALPPGTSPHQCKLHAPMALKRDLSAHFPAQLISKSEFPMIQTACVQTVNGSATSHSAVRETAAQMISASISTLSLTLRLRSRSETSTTFGNTSAVSLPLCQLAWTVPELVSSPTTIRYGLNLISKLRQFSHNSFEFIYK